MAMDISQEEEDIKPDMTPMIDIIFLLLIFFLLTTRFIPDEKFISSLLPTNKGQGAPSQSTVIDPPQDLNIMAYPADMVRNQQPSWYDKEWKDKREVRVVKYRVGAGDEYQVQGQNLAFASTEQAKWEEVEKAHAFLDGELEKREQHAATRKEEDPVVINCFSGLPWKYALLIYDAVRNFEREKGGSLTNLLDAREVSFAPPRVRDYHQWELGNELYEIVNKK